MRTSPWNLIKQKVYTFEALNNTVSQWKINNQTIVFTNGCFDLLHLGHINYLLRTSSLADKMIVGINSDASVSKLKGINRPLQKENDRALILANFSFIDAVVVFDEPTPLKLITTYQPNIITKGGDYDVEGVVGGKETMDLGGSVVLLPFIPGHSTSAIEQKILNR